MKARDLRRGFDALKDRLLAPGTPRRALYDRATWAVKRGLHAEPPPPPPPTAYQRWRLVHAPNDETLEKMRTDGAAATWPRLSVIVHAARDRRALRRTIASIEKQVYAGWELCIGHDRALARVVARYARADPRIRPVRLRGLVLAADAINAGIAASMGEFVAVVRAGDELAPDALWRVAEQLAHHGDDLVYTDEDRVDAEGAHHAPFFKPGWSPDLLMSMDYLSRLLVARRSLVVAVGGARRWLPGAECYDLALRLGERTRRIGHLPRVLYHAHPIDAPASASASARTALRSAATRRGWPGAVSTSAPGRFRVRYAIAGQPRVAIIIPTRDKVDLLDACIRSIEKLSTYPSYELIVVDNGSREEASLRYLAALGQRHRVIVDDGPFNWSALNNRAAQMVNAPYLVFLNNDVELISPDWIEAMLEHAQRPQVAAVGAKLLYADGTVQHAGVVMGVCGTAVHAFRTFVADGSEYFGFASVVRNCSAVTGACMMVRRQVFEALGGFDEALSVAFNDVDYCLRAGERGYDVVYTPFASLYHYESVTRGNLDPPENKALLVSRWQAQIDADPFYNPQLSRVAENFVFDV